MLLFGAQSAACIIIKAIMINGSWEQKKEVTMFSWWGGCSFCSRLGPSALSLFAFSHGPAPHVLLSSPLVGGRAVFERRMVAAHVNHPLPDLFTECMSEAGRSSATGLQQLTAEHFAQCLKEQRQRKTAIRNRFLNYYFTICKCSQDSR